MKINYSPGTEKSFSQCGQPQNNGKDAPIHSFIHSFTHSFLYSLCMPMPFSPLACLMDSWMASGSNANHQQHCEVLHIIQRSKGHTKCELYLMLYFVQQDNISSARSMSAFSIVYIVLSSLSLSLSLSPTAHMRPQLIFPCIQSDLSINNSLLLLLFSFLLFSHSLTLFTCFSKRHICPWLATGRIYTPDPSTVNMATPVDCISFLLLLPTKSSPYILSYWTGSSYLQ